MTFHGVGMDFFWNYTLLENFTTLSFRELGVAIFCNTLEFAKKFKILAT